MNHNSDNENRYPTHEHEFNLNYVIPVATPYSTDVEMTEQQQDQLTKKTNSKRTKRVLYYHSLIEPHKRMAKKAQSKKRACICSL